MKRLHARYDMTSETNDDLRRATGRQRRRVSSRSGNGEFGDRNQSPSTNGVNGAGAVAEPSRLPSTTGVSGDGTGGEPETGHRQQSVSTAARVVGRTHEGDERRQLEMRR